MAKEDKILSDSLQELYRCEDVIDVIDQEAEIYRLRKCQRIFEERRKYILKIDKFWYVVLSQHEDFAEYIKPTDYKYFEYLKDLYVSWEVAENQSVDSLSIDNLKGNPRNFSLTFVFDNNGREDIIDTQTITKTFRTYKIYEVNKAAKKRKKEIESSTDIKSQAEKYSGLANNDQSRPYEETTLVSDRVDIKWPKALRDLPDCEKRKSFFSFFHWRGNQEVNQSDNLQVQSHYSNEKNRFDLSSFTNKNVVQSRNGKVFNLGESDDEEEAYAKINDTEIDVEELATLFADDIFPHAVKYYAVTQQDQLEEELNDLEDSDPDLDVPDSPFMDASYQYQC